MTDSAEAMERRKEERRTASLQPAAAGSGRCRAAPNGQAASAPPASATENGQREALPLGASSGAADSGDDGSAGAGAAGGTEREGQKEE